MRNSFKILILLGLISSCSICYKYSETLYIVRKNNIFYTYFPKTNYYEVDYREDTLIYVAQVLSAEKGPKIRYKQTENAFMYLLEGKEPVVISKKYDTIVNNYCLSNIFTITDFGNICAPYKYNGHKQNMYKYWYKKDTLLHTNSGSKDCSLINSAVIESSNFFKKYPYLIFIEKKTGIPIMISYPFCQGENDTYSVEYKDISLNIEKKIFLLNKKRQLW